MTCIKLAQGQGFKPPLEHAMNAALVTQWSECGSYGNMFVFGSVTSSLVDSYSTFVQYLFLTSMHCECWRDTLILYKF